MQANFIEMPKCSNLRYILVMVCLFSRWVEAYLTRRSDSITVAKLILREVIPRFGSPVSIETDEEHTSRRKLWNCFVLLFKLNRNYIVHTDHNRQEW